MTIPLRRHVVYPGHPLVIATFILAKYGDDLSRAFEYAGVISDFRCPAALADNDIPGAGDCVSSALDLLHRIMKGERSPADSIEFAHKRWTAERQDCGYRDRLEPGEAQAKAIEPDFLELIAKAIK